MERERRIKKIGEVLNDTNRPLKERFRALFTLKSFGGSSAIHEIEKCFKDTSALLKHELAYCLGQMGCVEAINILIDVLKDKNHEPIVRHEAGEALGAIGHDSILPILEEYSQDSSIEVADTCQLAVKRIQWLKSSMNDHKNSNNSLYTSVDPAPPLLIDNVDELKNILMNEKLSLFERYGALFALRNMNNKKSALALSEGLKAHNSLLRHEVAFVLGQMREEATVPHLIDSLINLNEHEMVRHECAEALGAIATLESTKILEKYLKDEKRVVSESCAVALDMCDYENSIEFQYANF